MPSISVSIRRSGYQIITSEGTTTAPLAPSSPFHALPLAAAPLPSRFLFLWHPTLPPSAQ